MHLNTLYTEKHDIVCFTSIGLSVKKNHFLHLVLREVGRPLVLFWPRCTNPVYGQRLICLFADSSFVVAAKERLQDYLFLSRKFVCLFVLLCVCVRVLMFACLCLCWFCV